MNEVSDHSFALHTTYPEGITAGAANGLNHGLNGAKDNSSLCSYFTETNPELSQHDKADKYIFSIPD